MKQTAYLQSCVLLVAVIRLAAGEWDFIVVGAGASGCTIAPELAATGKKVLLLEAGGNTGWAFGGKDQQAVFGKLKSSTVFDVPGENERLRQNPENWWSNLPWGFNGRGIGGSGVMNGGLAMIPSPEDFNSWPVGWRYKQMAAAFHKTLPHLSLTSTPSDDGNLYAQGAANAFERLAARRLRLRKVGLNANPGMRANTFSSPKVMAEKGQRMDACQAFLLPAMERLHNLELRAHAEVRWITFRTRGHARGVILQDDDSEILLNEGGKIVLAAGSLQTARLLMVSGVGPRSEIERLSQAGLVLDHESFWVDNNEVGRNLHDHTYSQMTIKVPNEADFSFRYYVNQSDPNAGSMYLRSAKGPYAQYGPVSLGYMAMSGHSAPDVELLVMSSGVEGSPNRDCSTCFRILVMPLRPKARADLQIKTSSLECNCGGRTCITGDICEPALYMTHQEDKKVVQWAFERIIAGVKAEGYKVLTPSRSDKIGVSYFLQDSQEAKYSASHWAGTCQMGKCTDLKLKVKGTQNVFVADASLFPSPVRGHTVVTVIAVAHKAGAIIRQADDLTLTQ